MFEGTLGLIIISKLKIIRDVYKDFKYWNPVLINLNELSEELQLIKVPLFLLAILNLSLFIIQILNSNSMKSFFRLIVYRNENLYYIYRAKYIEEQQFFMYSLG